MSKPISFTLKVGVTKNPRQRIMAIQSAASFKFSHIFLSDRIHGVFIAEKKIHELINEFNLYGEWFKIDPDYIVNACSSLLVEKAKNKAPPKSIYNGHKPASQSMLDDMGFTKTVITIYSETQS